MNLISIPPLMAMAVAANFGFYHLALYLKRRKDRFNLSFAVVCLSLAAYDLFCAGLYSVSSTAESPFWQRGQITSVALITGAMLVFIYDLVGRPITWKVKVSLVAIGVLIGINLLTPWGVIDGQPDIKEVAWLGVTYYETAIGPGVDVLFAITLTVMIYTLVILFRASRSTRYLRPILILLFIFFATTTNDICISSGIYPSFYLVEYGFFLLIVGMAHSLLTKSIQVHEAVEELTLRLEDRVVERTRQLEQAHQELVEEAHRAGMASIATGILHNMGNVLNSVRTSVSFLASTMAKPALLKLTRANDLLRKNMDQLDEKLEGDEESKKLLKYYLLLEKPFNEEHETLSQNVTRLSEMTDSMCRLVDAQQSYADSGSFVEKVELATVMDDALTMKQAVLERHDISVRRAYDSAPTVEARKSKLLHVFVNVIKNAIESLEASKRESPTLAIELGVNDGTATVAVEDNGEGIPPDRLEEIFAYGFTSRAGSHGFGLHSSANYMTEMGGTITATSDGPGRGARFELQLPVIRPNPPHED